MAETFYKIKNFPKDIKQELCEAWSENKWQEIKEVVPNRMWHYCLNYDHKLSTYFEAECYIEYYVVSSGCSNRPHLDRGRLCAINVPIEVDYENSFFFCGKYMRLGLYKEDVLQTTSYGHKTKYKGRNGFYVYQDKMFETYNLEDPVIFSTKVPHGGNNIAGKTPRVIASVGFPNDTYEQVLNNLPNEWFE